MSSPVSTTPSGDCNAIINRRYGWQIELVFKRLKSLAQLGAFGPLLREQLTQWMPSNPVAAMAANQLTLHAEKYNVPLFSALDQRQGSSVDGKNTPQFILDHNQAQEMVIKLIEQHLHMLLDLKKSVEQQRASASEGAQNQAVDFAPRYFTTACRDLHRAMAWYRQLKKENL